MAGVVETAWQPGRSTHGGHVEFRVAAYWSLGGKRGGTGDRMVGVRGGTGVRTVGEHGDAWRYWGVPLTLLTTQGEARGHPLAPLTN